MAISLRSYGSIALLTLVAASCQTTPRLLGRDTQVTLGPLERLNPSDVAVAPIRLTIGAEKAPVDVLRKAAQIGLARKRYSPLSTELVDATVESASSYLAGTPTGTPGEASAEKPIAGSVAGTMEASYAPGDLGEDAVLQIIITRWDDKNWAIRRRVGVGIEARMVNPADPFGPALWEGRLDRDFSSPSAAGGTMISSEAQKVIAKDVFLELLARMPARNIDPGNPLDDDLPRVDDPVRSPVRVPVSSGSAERNGDVEFPSSDPSSDPSSYPSSEAGNGSLDTPRGSTGL